ncbi:beta-galactosidase [Proteiniphilum sp.]|uniref:beta-galactosidase n=1 Tax=Proteiniphilum sp. TaxID=1926877 RepID=UPI003322F1A3
MLYGQLAERFFKSEDIMLFGTYYYPEQWPREQWERDIEKMAEMGFDFTHYGEFAWGAMEPQEGQYDFSWLDTAVGLAEKHGLKVVMCTPTPTPPVWLTEKHPDVLTKNEMGIVIQHGRRQHASWSSDTYREYVEKIVTELAKRYGNSDVIVGWQIDNEPSHYGVVDYSDNAQRKFKVWLENKYETIDHLNATWGNAFWSQTYENFEQVRIPNARELPEKANPHAMLDFQRFCSDEVASFVNDQADVLRQYISPDQWITTNTMPNHHPVDPNRMDRLDFHTYTRYLVNGGDNGHGDQGFRMGSSNALAFHNDTYRNYPGKVYGVMELQPGQVNWGGYNPQPYPGAIRLWLYHVMAGGGKFVCNYRFRQPLKGSEQYHYGMILTDGVTPSPGGEEYMQTIKEMAALKENFDRNARMPEDVARRKTAILYDIDSEWEMNFQPQTWQWSSRGHLMKYYNTFKSFGASVDIISDNDDFEAYPVLVVPAYELLDNDLVDRWRQYAENGGQLVITCRTGQKNREAQLWEMKLSEPIYELIGAENLFYDHLPPDKWSVVKMDGNDYAWNNWGDVVTPKSGTDVWGAYDDQFYEGKAAVTHRKVGKGSVTFIGADTDDGKLEKEVLKKLYAGANIKTLDLPEGVIVEWRDGFYIALNYSSEKQTIHIPDKATILIGSKELEPAGVTVWKE